MLLVMTLSVSPVFAFQFSTLSEGEVVAAGATIKVEVDPGDIPTLFGVLLMTSRGVVEGSLDSLAPFSWMITVPPDYYGPLTFWAVGRRYYPIANPPQTQVTIFVTSSPMRLSVISQSRLAPTF